MSEWVSIADMRGMFIVPHIFTQHQKDSGVSDCSWQGIGDCRRHVLPRLALMAPPLQDEIMLQAARQQPLMSSQDSAIADTMSCIPFVGTACGVRKRPSELYDPRRALTWRHLSSRLKLLSCLNLLVAEAPSSFPYPPLHDESTNDVPCDRVPELAGLLDPSSQFPAAPWTGANLALLTPLGLRTSVTADTILQAARYIETLAADDMEMAYARCALDLVGL